MHPDPHIRVCHPHTPTLHTDTENTQAFCTHTKPSYTPNTWHKAQHVRHPLHPHLTPAPSSLQDHLSTHLWPCLAPAHANDPDKHARLTYPHNLQTCHLHTQPVLGASRELTPTTEPSRLHRIPRVSQTPPGPGPKGVGLE